MTKRFAAMSFAIACLFLSACASTTAVSGGSTARIEIITKVGSGAGARITKVVGIDGSTVGNSKYANVEVGQHTVSFTWREIVEPGSNNWISVNFLGKEADLTRPRERKELTSDELLTATSVCEGGKTYYVDTSALKFEAPPSFGELPSWLYRTTGEAHLREKR